MTGEALDTIDAIAMMRGDLLALREFDTRPLTVKVDSLANFIRAIEIASGPLINAKASHPRTFCGIPVEEDRRLPLYHYACLRGDEIEIVGSYAARKETL